MKGDDAYKLPSLVRVKDCEDAQCRWTNNEPEISFHLLMSYGVGVIC